MVLYYSNTCSAKIEHHAKIYMFFFCCSWRTKKKSSATAAKQRRSISAHSKLSEKMEEIELEMENIIGKVQVLERIKKELKEQDIDDGLSMSIHRAIEKNQIKYSECRAKYDSISEQLGYFQKRI